MNILSRFARIRNEFGTWMFLKTVILLLAAVGIAVLGFFDFNSILPAVIVGIGILVGSILRQEIVDHFDIIQWVLPASMFVYGILFFLGERVIGISRSTQVIVYATVSVISFVIQFWALSDPEIVKIAEE